MTRSRWALLAGGMVIVAVAAAIGVGRLASSSRLTKLRSFAGDNVLVVTLDTTRADHLGCYGDPAAETPVLDGLARAGVLFERCITPTAYTLPSHCSIMTGLYPTFHGVRINGGVALADVHTTLAERLSARGYRTGAFIGAFVLDSRWGLGQGFEEFDDRFELKAGERLDLAGVQRTGDQVVDRALAWLDEPDARPFFAWVHLYDAHAPYDPPEPYRSRFAGPPNRRYDGEIAFADSQVGRLLDWLRTKGLDGRTVVVVVGDHGEGLGDHGESEHGYFIYDYAVHVPLLVRLPGAGFRGERVPAQVRTIDIVPTVLDLVGAEKTGTIQGESLIGLLADPHAQGPKYAYAESVATELQYGWSALYGLRTADFKFIEAPRSELYDLGADPTENENLVERRADLAGTMRSELDRIRQESAAGAPETQDANLDGETMRMLAALGYVGGTAASRESAALADPKDMLGVWEAIGASAQLIYKDQHAEAARHLEEVLGQDPANPQARFLLAMCYDKLGRAGDAKGILDGILKDDPNSVRALIALAGILSEEGRGGEVVAMCRKALAVDDRNAQAYELIADVHMRAGDHAGALPYLEKAVEIQPKLNRTRNNLAACLVAVGRSGEADRLLRDILASHPKFPLANFNLGLLYEQEHRLDDARRAYSTELEYHPDNVPARFNLGNLLLRQGDVDGAEEQMRTLIAKAPNEPRPYFFLARAMMSRGEDPAEQFRLVRQGLERATAADLKALGYFLLADIYSRQGRPADVESALAKARAFRARSAARTTSAGSG